MDEVLTVVIQKDPINQGKCSANRFIARPGDVVTFLFPGERVATIKFKDGVTPFNASKLDLRPDPDTGATGIATKTVKVENGDFNYEITWPGGGSGDGGGDVKGSRR